MQQRYFDDYVEAYIKHGHRAFTRSFRWNVLVGLYTIGELDDDAEKGLQRTFTSKIHGGGQTDESSFYRRIWPIRKAEYGPVVTTVRLGRLADANDVTVPDYSVSTVHMEFGQTDGRVWIRDLGSHNGTALNGIKISEKEAVDILDEAELAVGRVKFEYLARETFYERVARMAKARAD